MQHHNESSIAVYSVAIMLGLSVLFLGPLLTVLAQAAAWWCTESMRNAYFSGMGCLLAIWLAVGKSAIWLRLALATLPGIAWGLAFRNSNGLDSAIAAILVPLASLPSFGIRSLGYRLVRIRARAAREEKPIAPGPIQFSLRQLFGLTAAVAVYAFVGRLAAKTEGPFMVAFFVLLSLSGACAARAALGWRHALRRLFVIAVISGAIPFLVLTLSDDDSWPHLKWLLVRIFTGWAAFHLLVVGAALTLFREVGYRLIRLPARREWEAEGTYR
jgi:hypothetical protein